MQQTLELRTTYGNGTWKDQFHQTVEFTADARTENRVLNLYPELKYQTMVGFGGAITEAAAYVYSLMNEEQRHIVMESYFSAERMNYQSVRIPIDSCDFSREQFEAWTESGELDFRRVEQLILPMLRDAEKAAGHRLPIMLSPWSPPVIMKTNGKRNHGGKLKPEFRAQYADYLCRYILEYRNRGFHIACLTLQNEPNAIQTWDSCIYTAREEKEFLRDFMWPAMEKYSLTDIEIYLWDHNKERAYEWMRDIIDEETDHMIAGAAVHWYSGDHFEALDLCRHCFPNKKLLVSESCIELYKFIGETELDSAQSFAHEMLGDLNHGICFFYDWNLLLDENGGPNYAGNFCLAPFMYDSKNQELMPKLLQQYVEHFSHILEPGSVRIATTRFSEAVEVTAWQRPDGAISLVVLNRSGEAQPVCIRLCGMEADFILMPRSISSGTIR